jgi:hypothetical protein
MPGHGRPPPRPTHACRAPTEIFVPEVQYPDGFYVWVSDGRCYYDDESRILFHYPSDDAPSAEHFVRLRPPSPKAACEGWSYFFHGRSVITH